MGVKSIEKFIGIVISILLVTGILGIIPGTADKAEAASKAHMKSLNLKWDLKNNKTVSFKTSWPGVGFQTMTATIKNLKITKASKKGYKKATFKVVINNKFNNPSKKQISAIKNFFGDYNVTWGSFYISTVDYKTGKCLVDGNKYKVKEKWGKIKYSGGKKIKHAEGYTIWAFKTATVNATITFPSKYKDLCVGVYGDPTHYGSLTADEVRDYGYSDRTALFNEGETPFGKTSFYDWRIGCGANQAKSSWYKKTKSNSHWIRLK